MHLIVVGLSHRTAPVEQREKAVLTDTSARAVVRDLVAHPAIEEAVALSTCNRTEIYLRGQDSVDAEEAACAAIVEHTRISRDEFNCARYAHREERAAAHLFRVASSLDAMVLGESEIQGQVRAAFDRAREEASVGPVLDALFRKALEAGKRARTETSLGAGAVSVASVAVELATEVVADVVGSRVLVIGAGDVAVATAQALVQAGVTDVVVANRTLTAAHRLAERIGGDAVDFEQLADELARADIVISSTDAPHLLLGHPEVETAMRARPGRPMVLIDIAVPRDLDAAAADVPGVTLYDIDDLERVVEVNLNGRRVEADRAENIVAEEATRFGQWRRGLAVVPTITSLRDKAEAIRQSELDKTTGQWNGLSEQDRERIDQLTRSIVNRLLHEPTVRLKDAVDDGDVVEHVETVRHLFGLEADTST
jgi:glutamyl-tRNA reductase